MRVLYCLIIALHVSVAISGDDDQAIKEQCKNLVANAKLAAKDKAAKLEKKIPELKAALKKHNDSPVNLKIAGDIGVINGKTFFKNNAAKKQCLADAANEISKTERRIKALNDGDVSETILSEWGTANDVKAGTASLIEGIIMLERIDDNSCIAALVFPRYEYLGGVRVLSGKYNSIEVLLKGVSTKGVSYKQKIDVSGPMICFRTVTIHGSTYQAITPMSIVDIQKRAEGKKIKPVVLAEAQIKKEPVLCPGYSVRTGSYFA